VDDESRREGLSHSKNPTAPERFKGAMKIVLDTHVLIWWVSDSKRLTPAHRRALKTVSATSPAYVCDITLLEIATLVRRGRYRVDLPIEDWLTKASAPPLVERVALSPKIAAEVHYLPHAFHGDPADQVIVATARVLGAALLTADGNIIDSKLVRTI
jgi:PIN domain nuclease of toxin-antitoxin system